MATTSTSKKTPTTAKKGKSVKKVSKLPGFFSLKNQKFVVALVLVVGFAAGGSYWLYASSSAAPAKAGFNLNKAWGCKDTSATLRAGPGGKVGSEGSCVKAAQSIVNGANRLYPNSNWSIIEEDRLYGGQSAAAVTAYQRYMGISADGVVGRETWEKMLDTCEYLRGQDIVPSGC